MNSTGVISAYLFISTLFLIGVTVYLSIGVYLWQRFVHPGDDGDFDGWQTLAAIIAWPSHVEIEIVNDFGNRKLAVLYLASWVVSIVSCVLVLIFYLFDNDLFLAFGVLELLSLTVNQLVYDRLIKAGNRRKPQ